MGVPAPLATPPAGAVEQQAPGRGHIILTPDLFAEKAKKVSLQRSAELKADDYPTNKVRRPYTGIRIKGDTHSVLSIYKQDSDQPIPLVTSGGSDSPDLDREDLESYNKTPKAQRPGFIREYADFIIQSVEEQRVEKQQMVDTFGDTYIFFYGQQPRTINFSGVLVNSADFNWRSQFWHNYDRFLRGTKLVEQNARAYISFDTIVVEGYPLSVNAVENADNPYVVQFQLTLFVTGYYDFSPIGFPFEYRGKEGAERYMDWTHWEGEPSRLQIDTYDSKFAMDAVELQAFLQEQNTKWNLDAFSSIRSEISNARYALYQKLAELRRTDFVAGMGHLMNQSQGLIDDLKLFYQAANQVVGTFACYGIPLIANNVAFAADPIGMIKYALGISSPGSFAYEFAINRALEAFNTKMDMANNILEGLGTPDTVKASAIRSVGPFVKVADGAIGTTRRSSASSGSGASSTRTTGNFQDGGYLGHSGGRVGRTFSSVTREMKERLEGGEAVVVGVGDSFKAYPYATSRTEEMAYEEVYGDRDYAKVIESDPSVLLTLKESYGDIDPSVDSEPQGYEEGTDVFSKVAAEFQLSNVGSYIDPEAIEEVYKTGVSSRFVLTSNQVHYILDLVNQKTGSFSDEDTTGIRGVDDDDSPIDPVA